MRRRPTENPEIPIAPMIDCVFLMLVYFMTTSSLEKAEADLAFPGGGTGVASDPLPAVDEQEIAIRADGIAAWNGSAFELLDPGGAASLRTRLQAFAATCADAGSKPSLRLLPDPATPHQAIVNLLDAVTLSGIETIYFP